MVAGSCAYTLLDATSISNDALDVKVVGTDTFRRYTLWHTGPATPNLARRNCMVLPYRVGVRIVYALYKQIMSISSALFALLSLFDAPPPSGLIPKGGPIPPECDDEIAPAPSAPPTVKPARKFQRLHPRVLVAYASVFGAVMIMAAYTWYGLIRENSPADWFPTQSWLLNSVVGLVVGCVFVGLEVIAEKHIPSLKNLERMFLSMIDMRALRWHHAVILGLLAGFPEEILFRGTIQPELGVLPTAILFGVLHAATLTYFLYASAAGLMLGLLVSWSGGLWSAVAAHTIIDVIMFLVLMRTWRHSQASSAPVLHSD